jgi:molecular chaperone GrpE (heat shock protein)
MSIEVEVEVILELWDSVKDFIPAKSRTEVAENFLSVLANYGVDPKELGIIAEEDPNLHNAYETLFAADVNDDDDYDDGDDYTELNFD